MKKTAFVTGGSGFIGINLIEQLVADDWDVTALYRPTSDLTYLKRFPIRLIEVRHVSGPAHCHSRATTRRVPNPTTC